MNIAGIDWGGDGPALLFVHPTGFPAGFFDPLARELRDSFRVVGVDLRGHGASDKPAADSGLYSYELMAEDVIAFLDRMGLDSVMAVGQSLGGGVCVLVDKIQPGRIATLVLAEGIAHPPVEVPSRAGGAPADTAHDNFMASIARKRRAVWPSRQTMIESYGGRPPLNELAPEALAAYIEWGTIERADGQVELACPPEIEAAVFEAAAAPTGAATAWEHLPSLTADAVVLAGTRSDLPQEWFRDQAMRAGAPFVAVEGGHFFLQEDITRGVALVRKHLRFTHL
ncbi:MAG: alpha/beta hydrolase [Actinobacteria bacterium]|nr:alpha/beta hydrolase [Actinomycetota bacterium]